MSEIDYLNDPLLATLDEKPRAARTPLVEQANEVLDRINAFYVETGHEPVSEKGRSVIERMLANELAGLRASRADLAGLQASDVHALVFSTPPSANPMDDPLLSDDSDIFQVRETLQHRAASDYIADRGPCLEYDRFKPLFDTIRRSLEERLIKPVPFHQERVDIGEFFVLKGQLIHVADMRDPHQRNGKEDARLRLIFDNETESNLLMSSLVRRLYEDKDARRIPTTNAGPLFEGVSTGFVYVLRSLSHRPELAGLLKVGTTAGSVEDRVSRASTQATFLFADVQIVETYELIGHSAKEAERLIHRQLRPHHVALKVTGPDGRQHSATEWFRIDAEAVADAIAAALGQKVRMATV